MHSRIVNGLIHHVTLITVPDLQQGTAAFSFLILTIVIFPLLLLYVCHTLVTRYFRGALIVEADFVLLKLER